MCECDERERADGAGVSSIYLYYPGLSFGAMILQAGHLDVGIMIINGPEVRDASPCHRDAAFII